MIPDRIVTRIQLRGGDPQHSYPSFTVGWERREGSQLSYEGTGNLWQDGNNEVKPAHALLPESPWDGWRASLSLTIPAYHLFFTVEPCGGGCWRSFDNLPPVLDVSTFWWASHLFLHSLRDHPEWVNPKPAKP